MRQYAKDAGVSYTTVHIIENGGYTPSPNMIQKLTSKQANPQNGITYEDIMNAAGYKTELDDAKVDEKVREMAAQIIAETDKSDEKVGFERQPYDNYTELVDQLDDRAKGLIFLSLAKAGMAFSYEMSDERFKLLMKSDLIISIDKGRIKKWKMHFFCTPDGRAYSRISTFVAISRFLTYPDTKDMKFSIVTNDPSSFAYFKKYEHALAFRGDLSIILVDISIREIVEEVYLSNYFLDDDSDEFFIA